VLEFHSENVRHTGREIKHEVMSARTAPNENKDRIFGVLAGAAYVDTEYIEQGGA